MSTKEADIIKNLRLGIPAAALAVAPTTSQALEKEAPHPQEHRIEQAAQPQKKANEKNTYRAEDKFIYDEEGLKHIQKGDTLSFARETTNPQQEIRQQKQSLFAAYAQAESQNELYENGTFVIKDEAGLAAPECGQFNSLDKKVTVDKLTFDHEFLKKYVKNYITNNEKMRQHYLVEQGRDINSLVAELMPNLKNRLLEEFNSPNRINNTKNHEMWHQKNDRAGNNLAGISPIQYAKLVQTDEISANIETLRGQREQYLQTGDLSCFSDEFSYYRQAVENGVIVPGSADKGQRDKELGFIMNQTQKNWQDNYQTSYHEQIIDLASRMMKNPLSTLQPNDAEFSKREDTALTFEFDGRNVNLKDFRKESLGLDKNTEREINSLYQKRTHGMSYEQIEKQAQAHTIMEKRGQASTQNKSQSSLRVSIRKKANDYGR